MRKLLLLLPLWLLMGCQTPKTDVLSVGTIQRDTILGVPCRVYLPADYDRSRTVYPVLYLQHGMFGSENDWTDQGNLLQHMDSLLRSGQAREMVVIMPDNFLGSMPPAERQALIDAPCVTPDGQPIDTSNGSAHWRKLTYEQERGYEMSGYWETHFSEFMADAERRYRISSDPSQRAIAGLSMGGFHTMHVSHYLHGQFAYIGMFSALAVSPNEGEPYSNWQTEVPQAINAARIYWLGMGRDDFLYDQLQDYRRWLEANHLEYTYYESTGGHTWDNWQDYICRFISLLRF